jgi:putative oxidoreductase
MKTSSKTFDYSLLFVRVLLGTVVAAHGAQKLFGWFGGFGFEGTMSFFTQTVGLPYILALALVLTESVGMVALAFGLFSRFLSGSLIVIMLGAIFTTHSQYFFMNWFGAQQGEGFEYHLLIIGLSGVIALNGAGAFSLDKVIADKLKARQTSLERLFA